MAEPTEPSVAEAGTETTAKRSKAGFVRYLMLLPLILLPASAGAYLAYDYYPSIARKAVTLGIKSGLEEETAGGGVEAEEPVEFGQFKILTDLLVNPAGTHGKRFLLVNIGLESRKEKVFAEIDGKDAVVRDIILQQLGSRTVEELSSVAAREQLKEELRAAINKVLKEGQIDRLYFTQFVLQ